MKELTLTNIMNMTELEFFETFSTWDITQKKQVEKGLEIELWRLSNTISESRCALKECTNDEAREESLKTVLELTKLFTRMQTRATYTSFMLRKEARELMKRGLNEEVK